jgi:hypothetical protein
MPELDDREKTEPIKLLENRRKHLIGWLKDGEAEMAKAEQIIKQTRENAIAMLAEIDQIEIALNVLNAQAQTEPHDA